MTKALSSYPENERHNVARRRIQGKSGGLGYLAAVDFLKRQGVHVESVEKVKLVETETDAEEVQ
jgi:hypothetical protein